MIEVATVAALRTTLAPLRSAGKRIGFVPTMGALHEGHLALVRAAKEHNDVVVVSVFVNPTQFTEERDLEAYPRDTARDVFLADVAGADVVFAPSVAEVYPEGFATSVRVGGVSESWEGAHRGAAHFDGVALVVAKLLIAVGADEAWFGAKDAQQVAVVRRLVADLGIPTSVRVLPTVRDAAGLALSSRNARLSKADRAAALSLSSSLREVEDRVASGERDAVALSDIGRRLVERSGAAVEYWAIVDPASFAPLTRLDGEALAIIAARVGDVRLIDNLTIRPRPTDAEPEED